MSDPFKGRPLKAAFRMPLETGPYPLCDLCVWVWRPAMTLDADNPFVLKTAHGWCRHSRFADDRSADGAAFSSAAPGQAHASAAVGDDADAAEAATGKPAWFIP